MLHESMLGAEPSVAIFVGPGGQGKTAIVQHWLQTDVFQSAELDGVFFWSFYRGASSELCLRQWLAYAQGASNASDNSAAYCADRLLRILRSERWVVVLDGVEVVQHETPDWRGRFVQPDLGRLVEDLAAEPLPGVVVVTSRFAIPELQHRKHARNITLETLDAESAVQLLTSLGVHGERKALERASSSVGAHAKAVELLGTYLCRFANGSADHHNQIAAFSAEGDFSPEERCVLRVVTAFEQALATEAMDILALATAFRNPPIEHQLTAFLTSTPVAKMLHQDWQRTYAPFAQRSSNWLPMQIQELVDLRLLERVHSGGETEERVIDAHPLVRRGFQHVLGRAGTHATAQARAGFLRERPNRRAPATLDLAREQVELFHAYCDAGLWQEADDAFAALENPKHRFLAPAFELELLRRFFPDNDWRNPPNWPRFQRQRSLAICLEMLGDFRQAVEAYAPEDNALRGDALLALGELSPIIQKAQASHPWQILWQAYRCHALCLAGEVELAIQSVHTFVSVDIYEWVHVFECLLRTQNLQLVDLQSLLYRPPFSTEHQWSALARRRMRLDYTRITQSDRIEIEGEYAALIDEYDRGGMSFERVLTRLSYGRCLLNTGQIAQVERIAHEATTIAQRYEMRILEADAWELTADLAKKRGDENTLTDAQQKSRALRNSTGYSGPQRP